MCGIYGSTIKYTPQQVKEKLARTAFRGPDATHFTFIGKNESIILGHNRLSIIDLDPRSNQPFIYKHIHIVFNGEIYNFLEIKKQLQNLGYAFKTTSDTEVICAAYLEYGEAFINQLNGMFAFVIYDEKKQLLFGARDRMGQKPFYYYIGEKGFEFASQISSIQLHNTNLSISSKAISQYLTWGNIPDPLSIFNEIKKLEAGYSFTLDLTSNTFSKSQYWDISKNNKNLFTGSYKEAKQELSYLIKDASSIRLFADVPVGVFLSGGIDSSAIAALASKSTNSKIKTFSVKFDEKGFDESKYAKQVADHLQTEHHVINCNYSEGLDLIENFSHYYDEPFADASAIPSMLLAKHTRKHVTVALSGDGGDESFIGYTRYKWMKQVQAFYAIPSGLRKFSSSLIKRLPYYKLKMIAQGLEQNSLNDLYLAISSGIDNSWLQNTNDYTNVSEVKYLKETDKNLVERISDFDLKTYLNWDINTKVDRATMAYSLEARAPLLDYRIVEFARSLPTEFKYQRNNQKRILKDVLYEHVPKEIFNRPKAGFTMPFANWFRADLKDFVLDTLTEDTLKQIPNINVKEVQLRINQHMQGTWNRYPLIWKLLVLKQWLDKNGNTFSIQ
ncbi:asparagine synthase (glutamine-hydrolyzing) [Lacinutrix sp. C3R15]|uniref:asparagine synthase (glutamine-hydrolyzing) n=1 Tax=Flavobacteriaceae TaxID=49546 RepID=UPI001C08AA13|nr:MULTISPECIES: asparagine synthase (glutamine-hydrolyzing) [Flavobacteriaceae]MBU2938619.1 asparagine synthase (glutamine-hydrolyzing) [Lacinutrix sp. C3R15]MDO6621933.1 asparagine synthase (glutamine-hydrolyzing) [Oceanihabitans sp. 1_MG-2023]